MSVMEINGCRCLNQRHFSDAEALTGRPVTDSYTMNAYYDYNNLKVTLKCHWCDYFVEHDVSEGNNVQVKKFNGEYVTLGPPKGVAV